MITLFKDNTNYGFIKHRYKAYLVSLAILVIAIGSIAVHGGLKLGVDFTGGTLMQIHFAQPIATDQVRQALADEGLAGAEIQKVKDTERIKNAFIIRTGRKEAPSTGQLAAGGVIANRVTEAMARRFPDNKATLDSDETVGPKIGREIQWKAFWAVAVGCLLILMYVAWRFDFRFGVAAVFSLVHDVLCTVGFISVTGMEFNMQSVAVLLTIIGYSINDTVVVADRIRENVKKPHKETYPELVNRSINETLSRTLVTSVSVFIVLVALQLFAGRVLSDFTKPLLFGLVIGTYSSIFVVASLVVDWEIRSPTKRKK